MKLLRTLVAGLGAASLVLSASAAGGAKKPKEPEGGWPFQGPLGELDMESAQRGYQVYKEVCASCHSMELLSYRNLAEPGAPFYDSSYSNPNDNPLIKAIAAEARVYDPYASDADDDGFRPARPSDRFVSPYPDEQTARAANGGAYPPDFSVITKARGKGNEGDGATYVYALIKGYPEPEKIKRRTNAEGIPETYISFDKDETIGELTQPSGQYYNPYMPGDASAQWEGDPRHVPYGGFLAMGPQLNDPAGDEGVDCKALHKDAMKRVKTEEERIKAEGGSLSAGAKMAILEEDFYSQCTAKIIYQDGTYPSTKQMAYDVAQFLHWAGDPKQEQRRSLGLPTMIYLLLLAVLLWFSYQRIWRKVDH
ncbi:MAG: cytochrome c1 [Pseudomonadota bacterium]